MQGYWNKPEETAAAFRDGWFRTGDLATVDDEQFIFMVDRKKDMIITGGENVYSTEVENALYQHPAVLEAAVIGVPDERWGEAVLALVVLKPHSTVTDAALIEHCRNLIARYKCPRRIETAPGTFSQKWLGENSQSGVARAILAGPESTSTLTWSSAECCDDFSGRRAPAGL